MTNENKPAVVIIQGNVPEDSLALEYARITAALAGGLAVVTDLNHPDGVPVKIEVGKPGSIQTSN